LAELFIITKKFHQKKTLILFELNESLLIHGQSWILSAQSYYCIHLGDTNFHFINFIIKILDKIIILFFLIIL